MGDYSGGEVVCYNERRDKKVTLNTRNNPIMFDGRLLHKVNMVTEGPRFHHITYKHYEESSLTQDEFPVYDLAEFHPDSEEVNVLERDGYWVPNSEGLQELEDYVKFLFEARTGRMKQNFNEQLRLTYLFKEGENEAGKDPNRFVLGKIHLPPGLVSTVTQNVIDYLHQINPDVYAHMHSYGFLFRTEGCKRQPMHIDGENDNYFAIIPILQNYEDTYELFAVKVRLFFPFTFYQNKSDS